MYQQYDFAKRKIIEPGMRQAIVLIEDKEQAGCLETILRESFYPVKGVASDMQAGLELLRKFKKGVLFLGADFSNVEMPELLDKIRRRYPGIRVVMVASTLTKEQVAEFKDAGVVAFLLIPFENEAVTKLLARLD